MRRRTRSYSVPCPYCKAQPGEPCTVAVLWGTPRVAHYTHAGRKKEVAKREAVEPKLF